MNFVLGGYIYQPVGKQVIMNLYMSRNIFDLFMLLFCNVFSYYLPGPSSNQWRMYVEWNGGSCPQ